MGDVGLDRATLVHDMAGVGVPAGYRLESG